MKQTPEAIAVKIKLKPRSTERTARPMFDEPADDEEMAPEDNMPADDESGDMGQMVLDAISHRDPEAMEEAIRKIVESCQP